MRIYLVLAVLVASGWGPAPKLKVTHADWDGTRFVCPIGTDEWASEREAIAGKDDYVYCVPEVRK
jgi:hypothetical protein